jgi:two-component system cell cycle sensor histidine kinase/response regulator CckA
LTHTHGSPINVLLVEDNLAEARLLQEILKGTHHERFALAHVKRLGEAIAYLKLQPVQVVLLDLTLPDSSGLASLDTLTQAMPSVPIVVLTNTNDEDLAIQAVRHGAQDYLLKRHVTQDLLERSLRYAIERKQAAEALREANEVLEHRVQERTAELKAANAQLRREVNQRQRMQERLELAQRAGKIGTFEWNLTTQTISWSSDPNPNSVGNDEPLHYDTWLHRLHPDDRGAVDAQLHQAMHHHQGLEAEFRMITMEEETRWIAVKANVFNDQSDRPLRMIGIHMDITEKKQLEAQFLRAQRLESLGTLASGIAHDLNNILTPMLAVVQLLPLKFSNLDPQTHRLLDTLETSAHRGAALVQQILSFARGLDGKRVTLQVNHLLTEIKQIIEQTLPKSITITADIDPSLWSMSGDATQLHQVFMNLCVNARDAMPQGGTLEISAQNMCLDDLQARRYMDGVAGCYIAVTVSDTGTGIPAHILHRIFDPFFTTKDPGRGTGLGLSAVLGIVKSHGGFVDVQSQVKMGSQFTIFLPASQDVPLPLGTELDLLAGHQEWILVVDDEEAICEITKTTLETYNYRVLTAHHGEEAIALFAEQGHEIHCVLMDVMMPTMDGLTTISLLRRLSPPVRTIAMSGLSSQEAIAEYERLGFHGFLAKPFTTRDLLNILR